MQRKQCSVFDVNVRYLHNDIARLYKAIIIRYADRVRVIFELAQYLSLLRNKG